MGQIQQKWEESPVSGDALAIVSHFNVAKESGIYLLFQAVHT
jgi:hypothetical protein